MFCHSTASLSFFIQWIMFNDFSWFQDFCCAQQCFPVFSKLLNFSFELSISIIFKIISSNFNVLTNLNFTLLHSVHKEHLFTSFYCPYIPYETSPSPIHYRYNVTKKFFPVKLIVDSLKCLFPINKTKSNRIQCLKIHYSPCPMHV